MTIRPNMTLPQGGLVRTLKDNGLFFYPYVDYADAKAGGVECTDQ